MFLTFRLLICKLFIASCYMISLNQPGNSKSYFFFLLSFFFWLLLCVFLYFLVTIRRHFFGHVISFLVLFPTIFVFYEFCVWLRFYTRWPGYRSSRSVYFMISLTAWILIIFCLFCQFITLPGLNCSSKYSFLHMVAVQSFDGVFDTLYSWTFYSSFEDPSLDLAVIMKVPISSREL